MSPHRTSLGCIELIHKAQLHTSSINICSHDQNFFLMPLNLWIGGPAANSRVCSHYASSHSWELRPTYVRGHYKNIGHSGAMPLSIRINFSAALIRLVMVRSRGRDWLRVGTTSFNRATHLYTCYAQTLRIYQPTISSILVVIAVMDNVHHLLRTGECQFRWLPKVNICTGSSCRWEERKQDLETLP